MSLKSAAIFLLGLSLLCLVPTALSQAQETCEFRFFQNGINNKDYIYYDGDDVAPFTGKAWVNPQTQDELEERTYSSLRAVQANFCETCTLTIFSTTTWSGRSEEYNFRDGFQFTFPFCAKSFSLDCESVEPEEETEEMQIPEEEEEEIQDPENEEEFVEWAVIPASEFSSPTITSLMNKGLPEAIDILQQIHILPEGDYEYVRNNFSVKAKNLPGLYRFNVRVRNDQGKEFYVVYIMDNREGLGILGEYNGFPAN